MQIRRSIKNRGWYLNSLKNILYSGFLFQDMSISHSHDQNFQSQGCFSAQFLSFPNNLKRRTYSIHIMQRVMMCRNHKMYVVLGTNQERLPVVLVNTKPQHKLMVIAQMKSKTSSFPSNLSNILKLTQPYRTKDWPKLWKQSALAEHRKDN